MDHSRARSSHFRGTANQINGEEVDRLQEQLDELRAKIATASGLSTPELNTGKARIIRQVISARRHRDELFGEGLFGEPAWDMLLEIFYSDLTYRKISISDACFASAVPPTTALRWVNNLHREGWINRENDSLDGRRVWLSLTDRGTEAMEKYIGILQRMPDIH